MHEPNQLDVIGAGASGEQDILSSGGEIRSTDAAQEQSFTFEGTVNGESATLILRVGNSRAENAKGQDMWNLSITVQNPMRTDPKKIVKSDVTGNKSY